MKLIILAMVVAAVQATSPTPRPNASNKPASIQPASDRNAQPKETPFIHLAPTSSPAPAPPFPHVKPDQSDVRNQPSKTRALEGPVLVHEVAPVRADSFWWNRLYVIFTGLLVGIGTIGSFLAYKTLDRIDRQAIANEKMLAEIQKSAEQADKTIALAKEQAENARMAASATNDLVTAAKAVADAVVRGLEQNRQKDRARIRIIVERINPQSAAQNAVTLRLANVGFSRAYILNSLGKYLYSDSPNLEPGNPPNQSLIYDEYIEAERQIPEIILLPLQPSPALTSDEVLRVRKGDAYLHFYGFVRYRDVYDQIWRTNIHLRWTMRFGGMMEGQIMDWWEPVGPPDENAEIQE